MMVETIRRSKRVKFALRESYRVVTAKTKIKRCKNKKNICKIKTSQGKEVKESRKSVVYVRHIDADVVDAAIEPKGESWN